MINNTEVIKLDRSRITIKLGDYVEYENEIYKISQLIDSNEVVGINIITNRACRLTKKNLKPISMSNIDKHINIYKDLSEIADSEYQEMEKRYLAIQPLLEDNLTRDDIIKHSKTVGVHYTTLYRWLRLYKSTGTLTGLISKTSGRIKGEKRLDYKIEKIIQNVINNYYLTKQKPSIQAVINKINIECKNNSLTAPGKNTVRNRIKDISEYEKLKKQGNRSIARTRFEPVPGKFEADYPLQLIEIDHTPVDLILVDDDTRKPIGRPWITLAIDIYSRMIVGYYLTLDAPSVTSVAMCITNAVLPKDELLLNLDIDSNWDVWGFPDTIHVDNGADFRAEAIRKAGLIHGINIEFRPVGRANFGGHIERVIGTIMKAVHEIPGTTFSNISEKQSYNSDEHACFTFSEFEKWFVTYITKIYHKRKHHGIMTTPEQEWENGVFGDNQAMGLMSRPTDPMSITIDFLPIFKRTIQKNGVNIEGLNYYDHILRTKINQMDESGKNKKQFTFKRDPRNISYVWFYDEDTMQYFKINLADQSIPAMTLWEFEAAKNIIREKSNKIINNEQILEAHEELHKQISSSVKKSKKARRNEQKLKNTKIANTISVDKTEYNIRQNVKPVNSDDIWGNDVPDFG